MKIAHISDIHLDSQENPECLTDIDMLLSELLRSGHDHIVLTGDIVDVANFDDLYRLREIFESHGILNWEKVTIIPGNHDIFGKYEFKGDGMLKTAARAASAVGLKYQDRMQEFCEVFRETITEEPVLNSTFPFIKILQGGKNGIAIVSFNSVLEWTVAMNPVGSRGRIDDRQLADIQSPEIVDLLKDKFVISLSHHAYHIYNPRNAADSVFLWSMELVGKESYLQAMKKIGVKVALHGHYHRIMDYHIEGIHFINSGSVRKSGMKFNSLTIGQTGEYSHQFIRG
jgi:3',5'-cyclic-AMP phosphodiesterase